MRTLGLSKMGLLMVVATLLVSGTEWFTLLVASSTAPQYADPETITLSFTIRDFMPITCANSSEIYKYWPGPPWIISRQKGCPLKADIQSGNVIPHPDFQIGLENWQNTTFPYAQWWAPSGGTPGLLNSLQSKPREVLRSGAFRAVDIMNAITPLVEPYLEYDTWTGLGKPVYCKKSRCGVPYQYEFPSWPTINPAWVDFPLASLASSETFRAWYNDDRRYSKRVGITMILNRTKGNSYVYDSGNEPSGRFHPLDQFVATEPKAVWPLTSNQEVTHGGRHKYWFTSECHTFFEYRPGKVFTFQGDDDFLAYVNNRLVVDLSGMHNPYQSSVDLDTIADELDLKQGQVYPLDIFHAERRMIDSNFKMTTNLVSGCNVIRAGLKTFTQSVESNSKWLKLIGSSAIADGTIALTQIEATGTASYAFLNSPQNIAQGFTAEFSFRLMGTSAGTRLPEGFAFVMHRDPNGLLDINGGSWGHLGARNFKNSVVIVFDMCADRAVNNHYSLPFDQQCQMREVRIHTAFSSTNTRSSVANRDTAVLRESIAYRVSRSDVTEDRAYQVRVVYYGASPGWLEVYLDNSLLVVLRNFKVGRDLGGSYAYLGLTSATGGSIEHTAGFTVENWTLETVDIDPTLSHASGWNGSELIADGRKSLAVRVEVRDRCNSTVGYGGYGDWAIGWMVRRGDAERRRLSRVDDGVQSTDNLGANLSLPDDGIVNLVPAQTVDNNNGTYDLVFSTPVNGTYEVFLAFGPCRPNLTMEVAALFNQTFATGSDTAFSAAACWLYSFEDLLLAVPPAEAPIIPPPADPVYPWHLVTGVGAGLSVTICICLGFVCFLLGARKKWRSEKHFVTTGQLVVLERDVEYSGGHPLGLRILKVANQVEKTNREMLKLKAAYPHDESDRLAQRAEIENENIKLQSDVKALKRRLQESELMRITKNQLSDLPTPPPRHRFAPGKEESAPVSIDTDFKDELASMSVFVWTRHPEACFRVCFSQRDVDLIEGFIDDYPDKIVGGDLFGYFETSGRRDCQVMHATGPGRGSHFGKTAFSQDADFTRKCIEYLSHVAPSPGQGREQIVRMGKWISFHKMQEPLKQELDKAWSEAKQHQRFLVLAVHIQSENAHTGQKRVVISPILFEAGSTVHKMGELCVLADHDDIKARARHDHLERLRQGEAPGGKRNQSGLRSAVPTFRREKKAATGVEEFSIVVTSRDD